MLVNLYVRITVAKMIVGRVIFGLGILSPSFAAGAQPPSPFFLPSYYVNALQIDGQPLRFVSQSEKGGVKRAAYASTDGGMHVTVEYKACDRLHCDGLYTQSLRGHNSKLSSLHGQFRFVSPVEFGAEWKSGSTQHLVYAAKVPKAVISWTRTTKSTRHLRDDEYLNGIRRALNQQRFSEAIQIDNVEIGRWAPEIHQHAHDLLVDGKTDEAVAVFKQVITWSATTFEAQLDFAEATKDAAAARASELAVWENAESPALTARAARLLGLNEPDIASAPVLERGLRGLQVVLIPLPPCDIRLIEEAGRLYSTNLDVPVRIARLPDEWRWGEPDRVYRQRDIQGMILQKAGKAVDFTGWTRELYAKKLLATVAKDDALTRFQIRSFLKDFADKPGQYRVEPYVDRLIDMLAPLRAGDQRTMFVGVTEADIYGGEANFLFSSAADRNGARASILSYFRMQAVTQNEPYQSRKRLAERLAKELVPASLKLLGIPRPADPTDPYSYSDGFERLAQKTLTLSGPTREALDHLRAP